MPSHRRRKALALGAGAVALAVVLYAALGYLAAPSLVRSTLVERAAQAGYLLRLGRVVTHPFALVVDAYDVQLATKGARPLLHAAHASVDVGWSSLWRRAWVLDRVALDGGTLAFPDLPALNDVQLDARDLSTLPGHANAFSASARLTHSGVAKTQGHLSAVPPAASGQVEITGAPLAEAWRYLPQSAGKPPAGGLSGSFGYRYAEGTLAISNASAEARLQAGGRVRASGALELPALRGDLRLQAQDVPIALVQPFLAARTKLELAGGVLSGEGRLRLGARPVYEGSAQVRRARIDGPQGELLGWESLATRDLRLDLSPFAMHAGEIVARALRVNAAIGPQGAVNLAAAFSRDNASAEPAPRLSVDRLRIEKGELDFADRSLASPFATKLRDLSGALTALGTAAAAPAQIQLAGRVGRYGDARVRGAIDLQAPSARTDVRMRLRNLALADFTPYVAKFAGYRVRAGRLSAELRYRVRDGRLVGSNRLAFDRLQLGEKVQSASAPHLPVELAVALLTDAQGRIDLAIPVTGDLRDPHVDLGGLIAKALHNTLGKIVSAPFRTIALLVGRHGPTLDEVRFDAGSAVLSPPAEETAAELARALGERPRLAVSIRGGYDAQIDRRALRRAELLRELAKRAGYGAAAGGSAPGGIDARDPKIVRAAERFFLESGGKIFDLAAMKPRSPGYRRRLIDALLPRVEVGAQAAPALGRERAQAVRDALVARGVDGSRVRVEEPEPTQKDDRGVPTALSLRVP